MKKNGKWILLVVVALLIIFALYRCGTGDDNDNSTIEAPNQQDQEQDQDNNDKEIDLETMFKGVEFPSNVSYEMVYESQGTESYTTRLWLMDDKMRMESEWEGQVFISIQDGENFYTLDPTTKIAMKYPMDDEEAEEEPLDDQVQLEDFMVGDDWDKFAYVKEETLNGVKTYVVTDSLNVEGTEYKMWIHQKYGIAVRIESSGPNPDDDFVMSVNDLEVGKVTDADFEIPEDYEVMEFGF